MKTLEPDPNEDEPEVVWGNTVDQGAWIVRVTRTSSYTGRLTVTHVESDTLVLDEQVTLAYQAIFGPDIADVAHVGGDGHHGHRQFRIVRGEAMKQAEYNEYDLWDAYHNQYATLGGVARALDITHPEAEERYQSWLSEHAETLACDPDEGGVG